MPPDQRRGCGAWVRNRTRMPDRDCRSRWARAGGAVTGPAARFQADQRANGGAPSRTPLRRPAAGAVAEAPLA